MPSVATRSQLRALHLCSGYGGFELGLRLAGVDAVTVCHVERDAYAAATLVARMAETHLDSAPIWDDLTTFDGEPWRGRVDIITAGFPCQPFSNAGAKKGIDDDRWLWPAIAGIVRSVGPRYVFLENVAGLVRAGLPFVLSDLADLGYDAEWGLFSAAEVGAPHKRERFWLLADASGVNERKQNDQERADPRRNPRPNAGGNGEAMADADGEERAESIGTRDGRPDPKRGSVRAKIGPVMADTSGGRRREVARDESRNGQDESDKRPAREPIGGDTFGRWPPSREGDWPDYIAQGGPKPAVRRRTNGTPPELVDALHLGGNGLVPSVAGAAFIELRARLEQ